MTSTPFLRIPDKKRANTVIGESLVRLDLGNRLSIYSKYIYCL